MASLNCTITGCDRAFHTVADLVDHVTAQHVSASSSSSSTAKLTRPTIDAGSSPASWEAFMVQFEDYLALGNVDKDGRKISELTRTIPKPCFERMNKKFPAGAVYKLSYAEAVREAKKSVVSLETLSVRHSNFLQIRQKDGEAFVSFLSRARAALVDTNYRHPCIHAIAPSKRCGVDGCLAEGASYGEDQLCDVLISGLADREVRWAVHAKPGIVEISIEDLEEFVRVQEDSLSAASGPTPAAAAASGPPPPAPPQQPPQGRDAHQATPAPQAGKRAQGSRHQKCACGRTFDMKTYNRRGTVNKVEHRLCKPCYDANRAARRPARPAPTGNQAAAAVSADYDYKEGAARIAAFHAPAPAEDWDEEMRQEPPRPPFQLFLPRQVTVVSASTGARNKQSHPRADLSCQVLNQHGIRPLRLDKTGTVMERRRSASQRGPSHGSPSAARASCATCASSGPTCSGHSSSSPAPKRTHSPGA